MNHFGQDVPATEEEIERVHDIFPSVPEAGVTVDQWIDMHRSRYLNPYQRLHFAVLEDALRTLTKGKENRQLENRRLDVLEWINGAEATLSFERICEVLDLNPAWLRDGLNRKQDDLKIARKSPARSDTFGTISLPAQRLSGTGRTINHNRLSAHLYRARR